MQQGMLDTLCRILQEKVYENAEVQAKMFMEYVKSSRDEGDDFSFDEGLEQQPAGKSR